MSGKDLPSISNYIDLHLQPIRKLVVTVEVLNKNLETIETIEGLATGGNISVSNSSLIRRTGNLSFTLFDYLLPNKQSILWMTNRIRVYIGLEDSSTYEKTVTHFCQGTYYITEPNINISSDSRSISISLEDNMAKWETEELETKLVIEAGTPLHTAMEQLMNYYGEFNTNIEFTELQVPYKLEFNEGDNILSVITKLRDLYMDWDCYYDVDGTFVFRKMNIQREDGEPISWRFSGETDFITSFQETFTYKNVKNKVVVIGNMDEKTGLTPKAEAIIKNEESPFHKNEIGLRKKVITESSLGNVEQCDAKARYELFKQSTFQEQATINTVPIYYLDGNDIIEVKNPATNEIEKYIIDTISLGLGISDEMSITAHKLYYDHFDISSSLDEYREVADIVIDGIMNKGWLYLSEQRIKDFYGLTGSGNNVTVRFEKGARYGTTAYVTGYTGKEKTQTLTVDLADFESYGESGDTGAGKAEYSDRILGHETVHLLMNDTMGVDKTIKMPTWFKEGSAEFIHGADERLKISIVESGGINETKLNKLIETAVLMLTEDSWEGDSDSYSAGYLIMKYLDKKISSGKTMKDLMRSIVVSSKSGDEAVKEAIVANTGFVDYQSFVNGFKKDANGFVKTKITLNFIGDELDTGSIGGSDHRGSVNLNAEDVFDNSKAVKGLALQGFIVKFDRP